MKSGWGWTLVRTRTFTPRARARELEHKKRRAFSFASDTLHPASVIMEGTILKEILHNCSECGERLVYNWIDSDGSCCDVKRAVTYRELGEESRKIAEELLQSLELRRGERAILCYPPGLDFIISFIACLRAGITAGMYELFRFRGYTRVPLMVNGAS